MMDEVDEVDEAKDVTEGVRLLKRRWRTEARG